MQTIKIVKKSGTGAHVTLPKEWLGKKVIVISEDETNPIMRKKETEQLITQMISDARHNY